MKKKKNNLLSLHYQKLKNTIQSDIKLKANNKLTIVTNQQFCFHIDSISNICYIGLIVCTNISPLFALKVETKKKREKNHKKNEQIG